MVFEFSSNSYAASPVIGTEIESEIETETVMEYERQYQTDEYVD